jgi:subtilisin family serine protease
LNAADLASHSVPLPMAEMGAARNFAEHRLGVWQASDGSLHPFNPEFLLVKFRSLPLAAAIRVAPRQETQAVALLRQRPDVQFAQLDFLHHRQGQAALTSLPPNDPLFPVQWHHAAIHSTNAWAKTAGRSTVRIAIVDTPFQMNHPDLAANADTGWDVATEQEVTASSGLDHSTLGAGMAAAVVNNGIGVAGAGNCRVLPINITGYTSEMYDAILWAADHQVRVVNISWDGADEPALDQAGLLLKQNAGGMLFMAGVNGSGLLNYPDYENIYCVSMTDPAGNIVSTHGPHIDFAAPGWDVTSTTTDSAYASDSGTSYSTPLVAGVAAVLFGINPAFTPADVEALLRQTAADLGPAGRDPYYGWGLIDFGAAVDAALLLSQQRVGLQIQSLSVSNGQVRVQAAHLQNARFTLWTAPNLSGALWRQISAVPFTQTASNLIFLDPVPSAPSVFYRIQADW